MADEKQQELAAASLEGSGISTPPEYDDLPDVDVGKTDAERAKLVRRCLLPSCTPPP